MIRHILYLFLSLVFACTHTANLSRETKAVLKSALEIGDTTTIDALYTSVMTGDTITFAAIITNCSTYLEQMATQYQHPTSIVITIDNNTTIRDLAMFDYFTDEMVIETMQRYLDTHRSKPFIPNFKLIECYKSLLLLELYADSDSTTNEELISKEDLDKALLAIIFYSHTNILQQVLTTLDAQDENTRLAIYGSLLRLSIALEKKEIINLLQNHIPANTITKPTLKNMLTCAHTFFQTLYCKNT